VNGKSEAKMTGIHNCNIGKYLLYRLQEVGIKDLFGVPGDFNLGFLDQILESNIKLISTCNELNAGYAADGYARINGIGGLVITYAVGGLSAINAIAGAYTEDIPVVIISGSPSTMHHKKSSMLHHTLGDYAAIKKMFEHVTIASELLTDPQQAPDQIDRAITACLLYQKPVYIELPVDIAEKECKFPDELVIPEFQARNPQELEEAIEKAAKLINNCGNPAILAGLEINKFGLQDIFQQLVEKTGYPFATMILDKTVFSEDHPQFIGYYEGIFSHEYVKNRIENSCSLICLGTLLTDANLGWNTAKFPEENIIVASRGRLKIGKDYYHQIPLKAFIKGLIEKLPPGSPKIFNVKPAQETYYSCRNEIFTPEKNQPLTIKRFFERMTCYIQENDIVIADVGSALFGASQMIMPGGATFIDQSYYCSIGYSVGATLGAGVAAPDRRVIAFIGDGAFQMTAQEISTIIRYNLNAVIFLINNDGYTIERYIHDGPYNDIQPWQYHRLPGIYNGSPGYNVYTEGELEPVLKQSYNDKGLTFIEVHFDKWDSTDALKAMTNMQKR
jgi:indolepyruvate decarboxylase